jgi:peptidyl-prolyl cis-trans isomerase B (cyclophilin B)
LRSNHTRISVVLALALVLITGAGGCGGGAATSEGPDQMHANAPLASSEATGDATVFEEEPMHVSDVKVTGDEVAVITTSKGVVKVELFADAAPNHVASFIELADGGFYNGVKFHRVVQSFVVQGGDPQTRDLGSDEVREITARQAQGIVKPGEPFIGGGGPGWRLAAEFNDRKHLKGTVAMARSRDVDSAGSQFYICLEPQPGLDGDYTVFGQVVEGMDVVETITVGDVIESIVIER